MDVVPWKLHKKTNNKTKREENQDYLKVLQSRSKVLTLMVKDLQVLEIKVKLQIWMCFGLLDEEEP